MTALEWVGAIVGVLVGLGIAAAGIGHLIDVVSERVDRWIWRLVEKRIRQRASQMRNQHWWWATPEQAAVWASCAEHMADGDYPDIHTVRDKTYPRVLRELIEQRSPKLHVDRELVVDHDIRTHIERKPA